MTENTADVWHNVPSPRESDTERRDFNGRMRQVSTSNLNVLVRMSLTSPELLDAAVCCMFLD